MCIAFDLFGRETKEDGGLDIVCNLDICAGVRIAFLVVAVMPWTLHVRSEDLHTMSVDLCKHCPGNSSGEAYMETTD